MRTVKSILRDQSDGFYCDEHNEPYWAAERLIATCAPDRASKFVDIVARGDGTVPTVQFELRDDTRTQLQQEALNSVMTEARQRAERLAEAENLVITGVQEIEAFDDDGNKDSDLEASMAADSSYDFEPGVVTVTGSVKVRYEVQMLL